MISWKQGKPLSSRPFIIDVFPVPGAPVITIFLFSKNNNFNIQSKEIGARKKNSRRCSIFVKTKGMDEDKSEEFYGRLREQLFEDTKWPSNYLYKFIAL